MRKIVDYEIAWDKGTNTGILKLKFENSQFGKLKLESLDEFHHWLDILSTSQSVFVERGWVIVRSSDAIAFGTEVPFSF